MTTWKPSETTTLVWTVEDGGVAFHVEAPTQTEADAWGLAAEKSGKHLEIADLAHLSPHNAEATR